jgi:hypothetical protein
MGKMVGEMKTLNRMALGTISSLLLSAGLTRTAQKLDPLTHSVAGANYNLGDAPSTPCFPCFLLND